MVIMRGFLLKILSIGLIFDTFVLCGMASALTYQEEIPVSFTFNRGLSLSVSASDLHIYNLTPGTSDDSNIITVTTTTNNVTGYSLTASVGSSTNASTNLVNGSNNFASIATNASLSSLTTDNTWGYSISTNNGSTWSNYSGLPIYTASSWKELASVNTNGTTSIKFKIGAKASAAQAAGDYTNVINFTAVTNVSPESLWDKVANQVKTYGGAPQTQTVADLQAVITEPTSSNPATDLSNSGVFLYDANTFGSASDANNNYPIYYYRGVLDSDLDGTSSTYGSSGNGAYYPNYVKLDNDTCWRIIRTTGSGGIKMIYNGKYSTGTVANSCANATTSAQVTTSAFNSSANTSQIVKVGYTYNDAYASSDATTSTAWGLVFGDNSNYSTSNTTSSTIKTYLENTWYANNMSNYTNYLEPSAGYCNDRSSTSTTVIPYGLGGEALMGNYRRFFNSKTLTLACPRGTVDLYTTSSSIDGNKQLSIPAALITSDEASFAGGKGYATYGSTSQYASNYNYNSYIVSGSGYLTITPEGRYDNTRINQVQSSGNNDRSSYVYTSLGVRPVISFNHSTSISSGSGTATDPWIIYLP